MVGYILKRARTSSMSFNTASPENGKSLSHSGNSAARL